MALQGYLDDVGRAIVRVQVRGARDDRQWMSLEVDTGVQPMIVTSKTWIAALELPFEDGGVIGLADGRKVLATIALIEMDWLGERRLANVFAPEASTDAFLGPGQRGRPANGLLGRELLRGCRLAIDYPAGKVSIETSAGISA